MRWAAVAVSMFLGLGFGIPCAFGIRHFAQTGQAWTFLGFPTYGDGPFERIGVTTTTALLAGFLAVCVAEVALALMLCTDAPHAAALSYALLPSNSPSGSDSPYPSDPRSASHERCWSYWRDRAPTGGCNASSSGATCAPCATEQVASQRQPAGRWVPRRGGMS